MAASLSDEEEELTEKERRAKILRQNVPKWKQDLADEILAPQKKRFPRRHVYSGNVDSIWGMDLMDVQKYAKQNRNMNFILVVVDLFSKFAWAIGIKQKTATATAEALNEIFKHAKPSKIWSDMGSEFKNKKVASLLKAKNIKLYSTFNDLKCVIAERFIRTLRKKIASNYIFTNSTRWIDILPTLINEYNNTRHSSIGMSPVKARKRENFQKVYRKLYQRKRPISEVIPSLVVGDKVRISIHKRIFEKEAEMNWSEEIFEITEVIQSTSPFTYKIKDLADEQIKGSFYRQQLKKTNQNIYRIDRILRRRKNKTTGKEEVLVKWMSYSSNFNSWEPADTIKESGMELLTEE